MKKLALAVFLSLLTGCWIDTGLSPAELQAYCSDEADFCLDRGLAGGVSQWDWVMVNMDCQAEYEACIYDRVPVYPTCDEIMVVCEDDVYNNCYCSGPFCLNCYARLAGCQSGYEDCLGG